MKTKSAAERKLKRAAKERLRKEECLKSCPWVQRKSDLEQTRMKSNHVNGLADNAMYRHAQDKEAAHRGPNTTKHVSFEDHVLEHKTVDDKLVNGRVSNGSKLRDPLHSRERRNYDEQKISGFVNMAEQAPNREATIRKFTDPRTAKEKAAMQHATEEEGAKLEWSDLLSQRRTYAKRNATMKKGVGGFNAVENTGKGKMTEEKIAEKKTIKEDTVEYDASKVEVVGYKPTIITAVKDCIDCEYLIFELIRDSSRIAKSPQDECTKETTEETGEGLIPIEQDKKLENMEEDATAGRNT